MPLLDRFEFVGMGFDVAYHASRELQLLHLEVTTLDKSSKRAAPIIIKRLMELINAGAASGSAFEPTVGYAERVNGPWDGPDAFGPDFRWTLRVRGVSPLFLRTIIEQLRRCGHDQPVTTMRVFGEEAIAGDDLGVDTEKMLRWLETVDAYVDECRSPGFSVSERGHSETSFSVELGGAIDEGSADLLKQIAVRWIIATASYVDDDGRPVLRERMEIEKHLPTFEVYGGRFTARFARFLHAARPSRAVLVNMLARAKAEGLPIVSLEVTHPRFVGGEYVAKARKKKDSATATSTATARATKRKKATKKKVAAKKKAGARKKAGAKKKPVATKRKIAVKRKGRAKRR